MDESIENRFRLTLEKLAAEAPSTSPFLRWTLPLPQGGRGRISGNALRMMVSTSAMGRFASSLYEPERRHAPSAALCGKSPEPLAWVRREARMLPLVIHSRI
jgi:hypothetical protein